MSIEKSFGGLTDPRSRPSPHDLREILVALCAILSGADSWVAIDGNAVRGSRNASRRGIYLVSAWARELGGAAGASSETETSNEITAITARLDILLLKSAIVTLGAMGADFRTELCDLAPQQSAPAQGGYDFDVRYQESTSQSWRQ
ncbi:hypothetical protein ACV229_10785 [Burkholderia sp. MR1-5-21]